MAKVEHKLSAGGKFLGDIETIELNEPLALKKNPEKPESKTQENNNLPSAYAIWTSFVDATSLHGIRYVFWRRPLWARIGWLIILLAFTGYYLFTAYKSITNFASFPINTVITQKYVDKLDFPAVTICPLNLISKNKMSTLDNDPNFIKFGLNDSFCSATAQVRGGKPCGAAMMCCCVTFLLFDGAKTVPDCTSQYAGSLSAALESSGNYFDTVRYYNKYGQGIDDMLAPNVCLFDTDFVNQCGVSDFTTTVTDWGKCFTFNADPDNVKTTQLNGPGGGLNILLDAQVADQTIGRLSEGFTVVIHRQGEFFVPWDGINVSPGNQAVITLHQQRIVNLEKPFETMCQNKKLKTWPTYTTTGCLFECVMEAIIKICKCRSAEYAASTLRTCAKKDSPCVLQVTATAERTQCDCPVPCHETRYTTEVYYSQFPDAGSAAVINADHPSYTFQYMRNNLVFLQIGYKSLSYELHEQKEAFGLQALLGEIGGNMGLFLGCSAMTIFEFADLLVALIFVRKFRQEYQM